MTVSLAFSTLALLGGCAVVPPSAWTFDPSQPRQREMLSAAEVTQLTDRTAQLQLRRNAIRDRIANERDVWARQGLYAELHAVGMELSPLERRLSTVAAAR
ncbi:MAG: hypothetical protein ABIR26_11590 [Ramlibacter sp.]